jgi:hypothetical protein
MCEEIYGYFTILLEQLSMFIGGVFKLELFLPEEYPMVVPKVCWNCPFTQDHIITCLGLSTMLVSLGCVYREFFIGKLLQSLGFVCFCKKIVTSVLSLATN